MRKPFAETYYERWMVLVPKITDLIKRKNPAAARGLIEALSHTNTSTLGGQAAKILTWVSYMDGVTPGVAAACGIAKDFSFQPWQLDGFMFNWLENFGSALTRPEDVRPGRIYKMAEHFGGNLHEKCKADFQISILKQAATSGSFIIQFPESVSLKNKKGVEVHNCLMTVDPDDNGGVSFVFPPAQYSAKELEGSLHDLRNLRDDADYYYFTWKAIEDHSITFSDLFDKHEWTIQSDVTKELVLYSVKCAMYIFSSNPDLTEYKPLPTRNVAKKERDRNRDLNRNSHGMFPLNLVGYSWQKPRCFSVGEVGVIGHWRWQPCGPEKKQVKFIWIDDHVRNYGGEQLPKKAAAAVVVAYRCYNCGHYWEVSEKPAECPECRAVTFGKTLMREPLPDQT